MFRNTFGGNPHGAEPQNGLSTGTTNFNFSFGEMKPAVASLLHRTSEKAGVTSAGPLPVTFTKPMDFSSTLPVASTANSLNLINVNTLEKPQAASTNSKEKIVDKSIPIVCNIEEPSSDFTKDLNVNSWIVDETGVNRKVKSIECIVKSGFKTEYEIAWLLRAITCIDLTTLSGDDMDSNVSRLCYKAVHPISDHLVKLMEQHVDFVGDLSTAAICVYPTRVGFASKTIDTFKGSKKVNVASVATGFPSGQYPLDTKLTEIEYCVKNGADEIDIVISRELVLANKWSELYNEIKAMKRICGNACMKTILATGECGSLTNVYKASIIAMMAGSDFIKTSTGKETVNATLQVGIVMCRAINDYYKKSGRKVGLKPAGGIRTSQDALAWLVLVKEILGVEWLNSKLFRIGASGLLTDIEKRLFYLIKGYQPSKEYFFAS